MSRAIGEIIRVPCPLCNTKRMISIYHRGSGLHARNLGGTRKLRPYGDRYRLLTTKCSFCRNKGKKLRDAIKNAGFI